MSEDHIDSCERTAVGTRNQRFLGIDLLRILCAYGVVVIHSGINHEYFVTRPGAEYQSLFEFSVPCFLAISFFLQASRASGRPFDIRARWRRLMIPYFVWSLIHIAARAAKCTLLHQPGRLAGIGDDPFALLFLGAASVQLYFLPLLFVGSCLCAFLIQPLRNTPTPLLILFLVLAVYLLHLMYVTGNAFDIASGTAFQPLTDSMHLHGAPFRLFFVLLSWLTSCLPYVIGVVLMIRIMGMTASRFSDGLLVFWSLLFAASCLFHLPPGLGGVQAGLSGVGAAIALSRRLYPKPLLTSLAAFTFGIFLLHDLLLEMADLIFKRMRVFELSLVRVVAISLVVYCISALIVWLGSRLGRFARVVLAVG